MVVRSFLTVSPPQLKKKPQIKKTHNDRKTMIRKYTLRVISHSLASPGSRSFACLIVTIFPIRLNELPRRQIADKIDRHRKKNTFIYNPFHVSFLLRQYCIAIIIETTLFKRKKPNKNVDNVISATGGKTPRFFLHSLSIFLSLSLFCVPPSLSVSLTPHTLSLKYTLPNETPPTLQTCDIKQNKKK